VLRRVNPKEPSRPTLVRVGAGGGVEDKSPLCQFNSAAIGCASSRKPMFCRGQKTTLPVVL